MREDLPQQSSSDLLGKEGAAHVQMFLDRCGWSVLKVSADEDKGIDLYARLVDGGGITNLLLCIQVRAGASYRLGPGTYRMRSTVRQRGHWRASSDPVVGVIYDPACPDGSQLFWGDISQQLEADVTRDPHVTQQLDQTGLETLRSLVIARFETLQRGRRILDLVNNSDPVAQVEAIRSCAVLWSDVRALALVRECVNVLSDPALVTAADLLARYRGIDLPAHLYDWLCSDALHVHGLARALLRKCLRLMERPDGGLAELQRGVAVIDVRDTLVEYLWHFGGADAMWGLARDPHLFYDGSDISAIVYRALQSMQWASCEPREALEAVRSLGAARPGLLQQTEIGSYEYQLARNYWPED